MPHLFIKNTCYGASKAQPVVCSGTKAVSCQLLSAYLHPRADLHCGELRPSTCLRKPYIQKSPSVLRLWLHRTVPHNPVCVKQCTSGYIKQSYAFHFSTKLPSKPSMLVLSTAYHSIIHTTLQPILLQLSRDLVESCGGKETCHNGCHQCK